MGDEKRSGDGKQKSILIHGDNLPHAWEQAMLSLWDNGVSIRTEYDKKDKDGNYTDPPSKDLTAIITIKNPFAEPRIHKNFPGGPGELEIYRQEVVDGIHDHWVDPSDPDKWTYTYHERLFAYKPTTDLDNPKALSLPPINQINYVQNKAAQASNSRRIQATTWIPTADPQTNDPPCLQRLWFRLLPDENNELVLNLNTHWRSRDAYKAWFMNAFALTELQKVIANRLSEKMQQPIHIGAYTDISDSFHLYGSYFKEFHPELAKMRANPDYKNRAWNSDHPAVQMMFEETREKLAKDPDYMKSK